MSSRKRSKSKGLGDTIAKVTKATGVDKLVHAIVGEDCGCDERREKLNKLFPYAQSMDSEQRERYETHLGDWRSQPRIELDQQKVMIDLLHGSHRHPDQVVSLWVLHPEQSFQTRNHIPKQLR